MEIQNDLISLAPWNKQKLDRPFIEVSKRFVRYRTRLGVKGHRLAERTCAHLVLRLHLELVAVKKQRDRRR